MDNTTPFKVSAYDENVRKVIPFYDELSQQVISVINAHFGEKKIDLLDTGCGTGSLVLIALDEMPDIRFTLADPSAQMLDRAREKLAGRDIRYVNSPSHKLSFTDEFDIVTAIQCHHYYDEAGREEAVRHCFDALHKGGIFIAFENIRMSADESDVIAMKRWEQFQLSHGRAPEDVEKHLARRGTEMFPITIEKHLALLRKCGFSTADILWTSYMQAGFWAIK